MKKEFEVLKSQPRLTINLTRDSVCAGDDCDAPHEKTVETYSFIDPEHFIRQIASGYLPSVAGVGHTWDCLLNDTHIGTVSIGGVTAAVNEIIYGIKNHVHFRYNASTH